MAKKNSGKHWVGVRRADPTFTIGIEEEYLLVDLETRDLAVDPPRSLMSECKKRLKSRVSPEFMQSQIEIGTSKCDTLKQAAEELAFLRQTVSEVAGKHGLAPMAASTHPFAAWDSQKHTPKQRYDVIARDMQAVVRRLLICGMHVHVGLDDDELRIDLLAQIGYFLPHLLALSTSSPFWKGENTGLKSYRLSVFDEMPRTGLPEAFESYEDYQRHVDVMVQAGLVEDATKLWWDVRPSARFPTLEVRVNDICTRMKDGVAIAALYTCLLRMLYRLKRTNQRWRRYSNMLVQENRWRAQRYGIDEGLVDFGRGEILPYKQLLDEMIELTAEDAEALDCVAELRHARQIVRYGTSAHRQVAVYDKAIAAGAGKDQALRKVVDFLVKETVAGL